MMSRLEAGRSGPVARVEAPSAGAPRFIAGIGGLRALAVLSVTLFHIDAAWMPGGFVGVDVFFVISGFVVAHSVFGVRKESFRAYFLWFYRRRFLRILPAIFLYVLVVATLGILFLPTTEATHYIELTGIASLFGASNFALLWKAGDYFAATSDYNSFTHTWSLAVEEQYYLLFPAFSYWMIVRERTGRAAQRIMIAAAWGVCLLSLLAAAWLTAHARAFAFYMLPTRLWELGIGYMLRYQGDAFAGRGSGRSLTVASASALALAALGASFLWTPADRFPFPGALLPCSATLALIAIVWLAPGGWLDRLLRAPPFRFFGDLSYSLYLWHWGVVVLMRWTVGLDTLAHRAIALVLMLGLSLASYRLVERPLRYDRRLMSLETPRFFAAYATAGLLIAAVCLGLRHEKPRVGLAVSNDELLWSPYVTPRGGCPVDEAISDFAGGWRIGFQPRCGAGPARRIFVIGDSHAGAYQRMMHRAAAAERERIDLYTMGSCHLLPLAERDEPAGCGAFRDKASAEVLAAARPGDILFLPGLYTPLYRSTYDATMPADAGLRAQPVGTIVGAAAMLRRFAGRGLRIIVEAPKPVMPTALFRCADWYSRGNLYCAPGWSVSRAAMEGRRGAPLALIRQAMRGVPGAVLWDPLPVLCTAKRCEGYRDGKPLYFDAHHLSGFGNDLLFPSFEAALDRLQADGK
jgi:peptidoglycan/LPS O-acetylase OafA/YrhL